MVIDVFNHFVALLPMDNPEISAAEHEQILSGNVRALLKL